MGMVFGGCLGGMGDYYMFELNVGRNFFGIWMAEFVLSLDFFLYAFSFVRL